MQRLYQSFQPSHYDLSLTLNRKKRCFNGAVKISGTTSATSEIRLHAKDLDINSVTVDKILAHFVIQDDELVITAADKFATGEHHIAVAFSGVITDPMHGLYPCYYNHEGAKKEWLATQFESHHAREVFPCVDEPEAKATFDLSLSTEKGVTVLSNMPSKSTTADGDSIVTQFMTTPRMSTYLLAFVVGEMQQKEMHSRGGVTVRTWATPAQPPESLDFALQHAADTIDFFDDYFGIPYPLPKSDNIAMPDFSSGAMENWGLITYRETALLVDPDSSSAGQQQYVASVVTHELSHQWFGNLVTMRWWDDLWLNESFASLMEYVGVNALHPEWDVWLDFGTNDRAPALQRDMLKGVQAIRTEVNHPDEISTIFDPAIVYAKGATVLNMLRAHIGDDTFRKGLRLYFEKHQYANTSGDDLWAAFAQASDWDAQAFMNAWLDKPGYPVVRIDQKGDAIEIDQERLLMDVTKDRDSLWPIPLFTDPAIKPAILSSRKQSITLPTTDFCLFNQGSHSLYVSNYRSPNHRDYLASMIEDQTLNAVDRLRLLHDSLLLARTGEQGLVESLELALRVKNEDRDAVWDVVSLIIGDTRRFIEGNPALEKQLKSLVANLVSSQLNKLSYVTKKGDTNETKKLRASLYGLAVWAEYEPALQDAIARFEAFKDPSDLDTEMRAIYYAAGAKWRGDDAYKKLFALYKQTSSAEERQELSGGMAATLDPQIIATLLRHIKNPDVVRPQDAFLWFAYLIRKDAARSMTWQWLTNEWAWVEATFSSDKSYDYFPRLVAGAFFGDEWLQRYNTFFNPMQNQPALKRVIQIGSTEIVNRTAWFARELPHLKKFLS